MAAVRASRGGVIWIEEMLPKRDVIQILSHATVFVCPSVYEPMGIVNLEAMACEAAVVATAVGGIPEVVEDGVTGLLVPYERADGRDRHARRPGRAGGRSRGDDQRARRRPGARRGDGARGPGSGGRAVRVGRRRRRRRWRCTSGCWRRAGTHARGTRRLPSATNHETHRTPPASNHEPRRNPRTARPKPTNRETQTHEPRTRATSQRPRAPSDATVDSACGSEPQRWSARARTGAPGRQAGAMRSCPSCRLRRRN